MPKPRRRNSEKRKEKSRDAARCRRGKESEVFYEMAQQLPLQASATAQLDKASVMRLAIGHLKLRHLLGPLKPSNGDEEQAALDKLFPKALEGFVMVLATEGDLVYLSEDIQKHLGLAQVDLIGHSLYDFTHPCDHEELKEVFANQKASDDKEKSAEDCVFFVRMKCTLTSKGRNINLKSAAYKVVRCTGRVVSMKTEHLAEPMLALVVIAEPIPHPSNIEIPLDSHTFLSKHNMDMTFTYCDERIKELLGYSPEDLVGHSAYEFHHALDNEETVKCYKTLFSKGQCQTGTYRYLAKFGGYAWVETQATVIYNSRTEKPQCVICVNFVVSGIEEKTVILSDAQLAAESKGAKPVAVAPVPVAQIAPVVRACENEAEKASLVVTAAAAEPAPDTPDSPPPNYFFSTETILGCTPKHDLEFSQLQVPLSGDSLSEEKSAENLFDEMFFNDKNCNANISRSDLMLGQLGPDRPDTPTSPPVFSEKDQPDFGFADDFDFQSALDIELEDRAPYISMTGEDDLIFSATPIPLIDILSDEPSRLMMGATETVFAPKPKEMCAPEPNITPMVILKQQQQQLAVPVPSSNVERNAGPPKMKRPMETNRLETGPPMVKRVCPEGAGLGLDRTQVVPGISCPAASPAKSSPSPSSIVPKNSGPQKAEANSSTSSDSVLLNLLLKGEDPANGYRMRQQAKPVVEQERPTAPASPDSTTGVGPSPKQLAATVSLLRSLVSSVPNIQEAKPNSPAAILRALLPQMEEQQRQQLVLQQQQVAKKRQQLAHLHAQQSPAQMPTTLLPAGTVLSSTVVRTGPDGTPTVVFNVR